MSTNVRATASITGGSDFDFDPPIELTGETREDVVRQAFEWYEYQSKRNNTSIQANPESTDADFATARMLTLTFGDGEETYPLTFPNREDGVFSDDEAQWVTVSSSIPVWHGPEELKVCVNGWDGELLEQKMMEFCSERAASLPRELLTVIAQWRMPIMFRVQRPDGSVFKAGVYASAITSDPSTLGVSMAEVLAALTANEDSDDDTV